MVPSGGDWAELEEIVGGAGLVLASPEEVELILEECAGVAISTLAEVPSLDGCPLHGL